MKQMRHGDVQLVKVDSIPSEALSLGDRKELAYGEVTGHAHRIDIGELFQTKNGDLYLKVDKLAKLSHEEHTTQEIDPGCYRVGIKRQYSPDGGWSNVRD